MKNETEVVLRSSSNMFSNSDDETNFPHQLFFANRKVPNLPKSFANNTPTDTKQPKTLRYLR